MVLDSPRLWNVILLELRREPQLYNTQLELPEPWLSRFGDLLSIHLDELEGEPAGLENPPVEVFDLLAGYATCQDIPRTSLLGGPQKTSPFLS